MGIFEIYIEASKQNTEKMKLPPKNIYYQNNNNNQIQLLNTKPPVNLPPTKKLNVKPNYQKVSSVLKWMYYDRSYYFNYFKLNIQ